MILHGNLVNTCWPIVDQNYFFATYVSRAFKRRVEHNFLISGYENSIWWIYIILRILLIFTHFCFLGAKYQKFMKNDQKWCNFIRLNFHDQKSKSYHRHGIWKPWTHTFRKNNFGQHLVNMCWPSVSGKLYKNHS